MEKITYLCEVTHKIHFLILYYTIHIQKITIIIIVNLYNNSTIYIIGLYFNHVYKCDNKKFLEFLSHLNEVICIIYNMLYLRWSCIYLNSIYLIILNFSYKTADYESRQISPYMLNKMK